jgi:hypothetical protein
MIVVGINRQRSYQEKFAITTNRLVSLSVAEVKIAELEQVSTADRLRLRTNCKPGLRTHCFGLRAKCAADC